MMKLSFFLFALLIVASESISVTQTNSRLIWDSAGQCHPVVVRSEAQITPSVVPLNSCLRIQLVIDINPIVQGLDKLVITPSIAWLGVSLPVEDYQIARPATAMHVEQVSETATALTCICLPAWHSVVAVSEHARLESLRFSTCAQGNCVFPTILGFLDSSENPAMAAQFVKDLLSVLGSVISPELRLSDLRLLLEATVEIAQVFRSYRGMKPSLPYV